MSEATDKLERIKAQLLLSHPWWASMLLHLRPVETKQVPTMAVDGTHLFFNPDFTMRLSNSECQAVVLHEVAHCVLLHPFRRRDREPFRWNIACDMAVNALLEADNITLPQDCVPAGPLNKIAEELYDENIKMVSCNRDLKDGEDDGKASTDGSDMSEAKWRDAISSVRGLEPSGLSRIVDAATESKKDWREELARFIAHSVSKSDEKSWRRVSRRLPHLVKGNTKTPEYMLAVCVDTSGSIDPATLAEFVTEVKSLAATQGIKMYVLSCDAAIHAVVAPGEPFPTDFPGGGGTSFIPALEKAIDLMVDGVIYFTDGDGEYPISSPMNILWVMTNSRKAPIGESISF